jgi:hypothetical protein
MCWLHLYMSSNNQRPSSRCFVWKSAVDNTVDTYGAEPARKPVCAIARPTRLRSLVLLHACLFHVKHLSHTRAQLPLHPRTALRSCKKAGLGLSSSLLLRLSVPAYALGALTLTTAACLNTTTRTRRPLAAMIEDRNTSEFLWITVGTSGRLHVDNLVESYTRNYKQRFRKSSHQRIRS